MCIRDRMRIALEGEPWIAQQAIRLVEGDPEALAIKNRIDFGENGDTYNKFYIKPDGSLSEKFVSIVILDILGNIVTSLELGSIYRINASSYSIDAVSYTHLRAHETVLDLVCRLLLEKKKRDKVRDKYEEKERK
eukprot:TRINITY_DN4408_c0_g1_i1.p1 TRINITY_DN4408_c0_g1~~TRINITY_DN4408_c0_g1_i1.p1  ORF type:complete len:135 (+),score=44.23 TRINITY_DN4408_c0_g1_i1:179-583(+)